MITMTLKNGFDIRKILKTKKKSITKTLVISIYI